MDKKTLIQHASIAFLPAVQWNLKQAISYAERLFECLDECGYGNSMAKEPGDLTDHYAKLNDKQKQCFDKLWHNFSYKTGKQDTAKALIQLGSLSDAEYEKIVTASSKEPARRKTLPPGSVFITPAVWLRKRRFDDEIYQDDTSKGMFYLDSRRQVYFNRFMAAYGVPHGRMEALEEFRMLHDMSDNDYAALISAAKKASQHYKDSGNNNPMMAVNWLKSHRYHDYDNVKNITNTQPRQHSRYQEISGKLSHAKTMYSLTKDSVWKDTIEACEYELDTIKERKAAKND